MQRKLTVIIEKDTDGYFVATVPELSGCYTQAKTLDGLMPRIKEVAELCIEEEKDNIVFNEFIGMQQIEVACA